MKLYFQDQVIDNINKIIYVDPVNGDDGIDFDGSLEMPFKTIAKAITVLTNNDIIFLANGIYSIGAFTTILPAADKTIRIFGQGKDTIIKTTTGTAAVPNNTLFEIYNCTIEGQNTTSAVQLLDISNTATTGIMRFFNINFTSLFKGVQASANTFFRYAANYPEMYFSNCIVSNCNVVYTSTAITGSTTKITMRNCAAVATVLAFSTNATPAPLPNMETCLVSTTFDTNLNITNQTWEGVGTGTNADGTPANIGVYGGYSYASKWYEWHKQYYSVVKFGESFYSFSNGAWSITPLTEGTLTPENITQYGTKGEVLATITRDQWLFFKGEIEVITNTNNDTTVTPDMYILTDSFKPLDYISTLPNLELYTYSELPPESVGEINYTVENTTTIRYQISQDAVNWVGYDGTKWTTTKAMTKDEINALTQANYRAYFGEAIYKTKFYIKAIFSSGDGSSDVYLRNIQVEYIPNQGPVILNPAITPDSVHAEFARLTAKIVDYEGDVLQYRVFSGLAEGKQSNFEIVCPPPFNTGTYAIDNMKTETSTPVYASKLIATLINIFYKTNANPSVLYLRQPEVRYFNIFDIVASNNGVDYVTIQAGISIPVTLNITQVFQIPTTSTPYIYWGVRLKPVANTESGMGYMGFSFDLNLLQPWTTINPESTGEIMLAYNQSYFKLGLNTITIQAMDSRGLSSSWTGNLTITNQNPLFNYTYNDFGVVGTINDPDLDKVSIRITVKGVEVQAWTPYFAVPAPFSFEWDTKFTPFGEVCPVVVQIKDTFKAITEYTFNVTGRYKNFLFKNKDGEYFTTDKGQVLKYLDLKDIIAGQDSTPEKVTLINQTNNVIANAKLTADNGNLPANSKVELSFTDNPFEPLEVLEIPDIMEDGDTKDFYVRVHSDIGRGILDGLFKITASGRIVG